jgi:hypothetical protein
MMITRTAGYLSVVGRRPQRLRRPDRSLDFGLPDLDGTDVIRRVRSFSEIRSSCSRFATGRSTRWAALDAGADAAHVHLDLTESHDQRGRLAGLAPAERGTQAREDLVDPERLGDVGSTPRRLH